MGANLPVLKRPNIAAPMAYAGNENEWTAELKTKKANSPLAFFTSISLNNYPCTNGTFVTTPLMALPRMFTRISEPGLLCAVGT